MQTISKQKLCATFQTGETTNTRIQLINLKRLNNKQQPGTNLTSSRWNSTSRCLLDPA